MALDDGEQDIVKVEGPPTTDSQQDIAPLSPSSGGTTHVQVHLESDPPGATVVLDGTNLGAAPLDVAVELGVEETSYTMELTGYEVFTGTLRPVSNLDLKHTLTKKAQPPPVETLTPAEEARRAKRRERREQRRLEALQQAGQVQQPPPPPPRSFPPPKPKKKDDPFTRFN